MALHFLSNKGTQAPTMNVDFQNSFIFILLCILPLLCYSLYSMKPQRLDLPPSPPSLPIIGHFHFLSLLIHKSFQKLSSKHGPLLYLRIFNVPIVLVSPSSVASEIFKTHDLNVSFRGLPPLDGSLLFGSSTFLISSSSQTCSDLRHSSGHVASVPMS